MFSPINKKTIVLSFWLVLLIKVAEVECLTSLEYSQYPEVAGSRWGNTGGDSFSYIGAMENYVTYGRYYFINERGDTVNAGRLPHYALPYYIFRQFFPPALALDAFVLFQLMVESIAIICLALLACRVIRKKWCYYASLAISVIGLYITVWSYNTFTDALTANLLIIAALLYYRYLYSSLPKHLLQFSIVLGIAVCLRPYLILLYILVGLVEMCLAYSNVKHLLRRGALMVLPLILLLSPWVIRNYIVMNKVIPFQQDIYAGYAPEKNELIIRKTLSSIGEVGGTWWDRRSAASYFSKRSIGSSLYAYPNYIRNDTGVLARLEALRSLNLGEACSEDRIEKASSNIIAYYKERHPVRYYFVNYLKLVSNFLFHNGSYRLPLILSRPSHVLLKVTQSLLYYLHLIIGSIGLFKMASMDKRNLLFLVPSIYLILLFPLFFGLIEWRYFLPFYHFHQLGMIYILSEIIRIKQAG